MPETSKIKLVLPVLLFLAAPFIIFADTPGQEVTFTVDPSYDLSSREKIPATLIKTANKLYFYADTNWWQKLSDAEKGEIDEKIYLLSNEFDGKIYPTLTRIFGSEPKPGIDKDERITIFLHPMPKDAGGYVNSGDVYSKFQNPASNEREMIYLNSQHIASSQAKGLLAHELVHLITLNQKDLLRKVSEEVWLNEARAEYAITLLGYNDVYKGSNLEMRVNAFLEKPSDSLTEWQNKKEDYGVINLFTHYLVDHYGTKILVDSLKTDKVGIESLNYALKKNNFSQTFSDIFSDWITATLVNDCDLGERYCYLDKNLKDFRIVPTIYYLPKTETVMRSYYDTTYWSGIWQRFISGGRNLTFEFDGEDLAEFKVPYLLCDLKNKCTIQFLELDERQDGKIIFAGFNQKYSSFTIMPFIGGKTFGFDGAENSFSFSWRVTVEEKTEQEKEAELKQELLTRISQLQAEVERLKAQLSALLSQQISTNCQKFEQDLYYGMMESSQVKCLQQILKAQGPEIYPEGLVTGNFLSLTRSAVIRFQEKYAPEILAPFGLQKGTGYVGPATRTKLNQLINK